MATRRRTIPTSAERGKVTIMDNFANLIEFRNWAKSKENQVPEYNDSLLREKNSDGKFGQNADLNQIKNGIYSYQKPELITELEAKFTTGFTATKSNSIASKKIQYNDLGIGVFSFDRASQSMYKIKEFYCPKIDKVVDTNQVLDVGGNYILSGKNYPVEQRFEQHANGKQKIRTNSKKVWAYFPKVKRQKAAVEIYVSCGNYDGVSASDFLLSGMAAIIIAKRLIASSIPVRINTVIGWDDWENNYDCAIIPVKDYNDPLDVNLLAYATSDPRFWRWEGYKACTILKKLNRRYSYGDVFKTFTPAQIKVFRHLINCDICICFFPLERLKDDSVDHSFENEQLVFQQDNNFLFPLHC
jgi:hypothetical protein